MVDDSEGAYDGYGQLKDPWKTTDPNRPQWNEANPTIPNQASEAINRADIVRKQAGRGIVNEKGELIGAKGTSLLSRLARLIRR